jgi:hypothetical protein
VEWVEGGCKWEGEGWLQGGEGRGGQEGEKERGDHLGFCGRKETMPQMNSDFASNGPQPFSHIHATKINFWSTFFWDITEWPREPHTQAPLLFVAHNTNIAVMCN